MNVVVADKFPERYLDEFRSFDLNVDYIPDADTDELTKAAARANILVVRGTRVTRQTIEAAKSLALIVRAGAGYDTIDVPAASERGIYVTNCPGKNSVAVAELAVGLIVALDRRIPDNTFDLRAGRWNKKEYAKADGLKGKVLGIAGLGPIGRAVARRAEAFELRVLAWTRSLTPERAAELGVERCGSVLELAERCDIVSVHLPHAKETKRLFDAAFFAKMRKGAMFINTSRGGLVDQPALLAAMKNHGLRVGLDVYDPEPSEGSCAFSDELFAQKNFVGTHHIGASTEQAQNAIAAEAVRVCAEFMRTGQVPNVVNVEQHRRAGAQLIVRHYDKVGVLASVLAIIRNHGVNVEEMSNTIFAGAKTAVALLRLSVAPSRALVEEIAALEDQVIFVEVKGFAPSIQDAPSHERSTSGP
jgi:D-3-phosphoglycerate dehydrogenase